MSENQLESNKADLLVSVLKSGLGIVPVAGSLLSEIVGNLIPNQRIDRIAKFVQELEIKLSDLSTEKIKELLMDNGCIDLFEEAFIQATRALTDERLNQIASVVRNSMDEDSIAYSESKYLLKLFQELNDQEVIWLRSYLVPLCLPDEEFREKHNNILEPVVAFLHSDGLLLEKAALQQSYKEHLIRLGLISSDNNASNIALTVLGHLLLKKIGLIGNDE